MSLPHPSYWPPLFDSTLQQQSAQLPVHYQLAQLPVHYQLAQLPLTVWCHSVGDPFLEETQMGPLVSAPQQTKVLAAIDHARQQGCTVLTGGAFEQEASSALSGATNRSLDNKHCRTTSHSANRPLDSSK